jgi:hypothetical protein
MGHFALIVNRLKAGMMSSAEGAMSLASLLLAFAPTLAARFKPEKSGLEELEAEIRGLKVDLADARRDRDYFRAMVERFNDAPLRNDLPQSAPRALEPNWPRQYQQAAQNLMAQQMQAQAWQAQQNQQLSQYQGLLGAQGQLQPFGEVFDHLPNCTPSRSDVLTGRLNHP